jgi:hypothetical protein
MLTPVAPARALPPAARVLLFFWIAASLVSAELLILSQAPHVDWRAIRINLLPNVLGWLAAALAWRFREPWLASAPWRTLLVTLAGALAAAALIWVEGQRQFGGCDFSELVDVAWRQHIGQQVYRDFICTLPPGFYLGARWAFYLFGVSWRALVGMTSLATVVWILWATRLLTGIVGSRPAAPLVAIAAAAMTQVVLGTWWYNPLAMLSAILFVLSALELRRLPGAWFSRGSYCASLAILLLMKPNIAGVAVAGASLVLALGGWRWAARVAGLSAVSVSMAWLLLRLNGIAAADVLASYRSVAGHGLALLWGFRQASLAYLVATLAMACALFLPVAAERAAGRAVRSVEGQLLAVLAIGGVYSALNNGESMLPAGAVVLTAGAVFVLLRARQVNPPSLAPGAAVAMCAMFAVIGCGTGWLRQRVMTVGDFFEWQTLPPRAAPPFFRGFIAGPRFNETIDQIGAVLRERPHANVFFGPRLEFAYAAFAKTPPERQPIWFEPGTFFGQDRQAQILRDWEKIPFDLLIFSKNDFTYYSPEFLELIGRHYSRDDSYSRLTLFHPRRQAAPAFPLQALRSGKL